MPACRSTNRRGQPCRAAVAEGEQYCGYHGPARVMPIPANTPLTPAQQRAVPIAGYICLIRDEATPTQSIGHIVRRPRKAN